MKLTINFWFAEQTVSSRTCSWVFWPGPAQTLAWTFPKIEPDSFCKTSLFMSCISGRPMSLPGSTMLSEMMIEPFRDQHQCNLGSHTSVLRLLSMGQVGWVWTHYLRLLCWRLSQAYWTTNNGQSSPRSFLNFTRRPEIGTPSSCNVYSLFNQGENTLELRSIWKRKKSCAPQLPVEWFG